MSIGSDFAVTPMGHDVRVERQALCRGSRITEGAHAARVPQWGHHALFHAPCVPLVGHRSSADIALQIYNLANSRVMRLP